MSGISGNNDLNKSVDNQPDEELDPVFEQEIHALYQQRKNQLQVPEINFSRYASR